VALFFPTQTQELMNNPESTPTQERVSLDLD
jgi:hypothetical protein